MDLIWTINGCVIDVVFQDSIALTPPQLRVKMAHGAKYDPVCVRFNGMFPTSQKTDVDAIGVLVLAK